MPELVGNQVGPIGYGLMGLTWRESPPPLDQAMEAMQAALNNGCTLWVGGEFYGKPEYNSMTVLKEYFTRYPEDADKITLLMKGGMNPKTFKADGSPEGTRRSLDNIISQLGGTKKVDMFNAARRDPNTPLKTTFGTLQKEYIDTGKLGGIALSECRAETIHEAAECATVTGVEIELSLTAADPLKNGVAAACQKHNIPIIAYSPIGRGLFTGQIRTSEQAKAQGDFVAIAPRFQAGAIEHNVKLADEVASVAEKKGCTSTQLAINWARSTSRLSGVPPVVIPIPGSTTVARVEENAKVVDLSEEELNSLTEFAKDFEVKGNRYPDHVPVNT